MRQANFRVGVINAIDAHAPNLTVREAQNLTHALVGLVREWADGIDRDHRHDSAPELVKATVWAEGNFGLRNMNCKIRCIRELRERFNLSLMGAKNIVDGISWRGEGFEFPPPANNG